MPASLKDYQGVEVVYETLPGWTEDISRARNFTELPKAAQDYVLRIEELLKVKVRWVGTGGDRIDKRWNAWGTGLPPPHKSLVPSQ